MSDEQRRDEETEVEGHRLDLSVGANDESAEDEENEFQAHIKFPNVRMD